MLFFQQLISGGGSQPVPPLIESVFDTDFINSIVYSQEADYQIRSAASEWRFQYSGTYLGLKVKPTAYNTFPQWSQIAIIIDGVYWSFESFSDETLHEITLPSGNKTIELIEGLTSKPTTIIGTFLTDVILDSTKFTKINETTVSEKLLFLGNSITVGANATIPSTQGYAQLFKYENSKQIGILGYGYGKVKDFGETQQKRDDVVADIVEMFSNVTTTKKLIISLGTNDGALDGTTGTTLRPWYDALLDDINAADSSIQIYCITPIIRSSDGALYDGIRSEITASANARAYSTPIDGKSILTTGDLADGVHPTVAGHKKYKDAVELVILP